MFEEEDIETPSSQRNNRLDNVYRKEATPSSNASNIPPQDTTSSNTKKVKIKTVKENLPSLDVNLPCPLMKLLLIFLPN